MNFLCFCRFCLQPADNLSEITYETVEKCEGCFGLNLLYVEGAKGCKSCLNFINEASSFKSMCIENDWKLNETQVKKEEFLVDFIEEKQENFEPELVFFDTHPDVEGDREDTKLTNSKKFQNEKSSINDLFICDFCKSTWTSKNHLKYHLERVHLQIRSYECTVCKKTFYEKNKWQKHRQLHEEKNYQCKICGKAFHFENNLESHIQSVHVKSLHLTCDKCGAKYSCNESLAYHKRIYHHPKPESSSAASRCQKFTVTCICGAFCHTRRAFSKHLHSEHIGPDGLFECCDKTFRRNTYKQHLEAQHNINCIKRKVLRIKSEYEKQKIQCSICNKLIRRAYLTTHLKIHTDAPCKLCGKDTKNLELHNLAWHRDTETFTDEERLKFKEHFCKACNVFASYIKAHNDKYHNETSRMHKIVTCELCGKTMTSAKFQNHKGHCTNSSPFICEYCGKTWHKKNFLKNHMHKVHLKLRYDICRFCNKKFYDNYHLKLHMQKCQQEPKNLCTTCGKSFYDKRSYENHVAAIHLKNLSFLCKICGASYKSESGLRAHVRLSHNPNAAAHREFSVTCVCGTACFSRMSFFQHVNAEHKLSHGKYTCCGRSLRMDYFKRHLQTVHNIKIVDERKRIDNKIY